ncbi:MAG: hypothetical protein CML46_17380, partial [Rhodobacteraceae bacterium]|nr:hypothetical protein [Paracoccaceae bacterium]
MTGPAARGGRPVRGGLGGERRGNRGAGAAGPPAARFGRRAGGRVATRRPGSLRRGRAFATGGRQDAAPALGPDGAEEEDGAARPFAALAALRERLDK